MEVAVLLGKLNFGAELLNTTVSDQKWSSDCFSPRLLFFMLPLWDGSSFLDIGDRTRVLDF